MRELCICVLTVWSAGAAVPPVIPGDSERGARLFENQRCVECHSVNGKGGKMGMDLGGRVDRGAKDRNRDRVRDGGLAVREKVGTLKTWAHLQPTPLRL